MVDAFFEMDSVYEDNMMPMFVAKDTWQEGKNPIKEIKYAFPVSQEVMEALRENVASVETVVLLSQQKPDDVIEVEIELDELDLTSAESKCILYN